MEVAKYIASLAAAALILSLSAFAKDMNSGKFTVASAMQVGSAQLTPGDYKAEWSGPANAVEVSIMKNGKLVTTVSARLKNLDQPSPYDSVTTVQLPNKTTKIDEIDFSHRKEALVFKGA